MLIFKFLASPQSNPELASRQMGNEERALALGRQHFPAARWSSRRGGGQIQIERDTFIRVILEILCNEALSSRLPQIGNRQP